MYVKILTLLGYPVLGLEQALLAHQLLHFCHFFPVCILYNTIFILLQRHYVICFCCTFKQDQTSVFSWTVPFILILPCTVFPWCTNSTVSFWWWNAPLHPSLCMLCWNFYQGRMPVLQPITLLSCNVFPWWRSSLSGLVSSYHEPSLWHHQVAPCILTFGEGQITQASHSTGSGGIVHFSLSITAIVGPEPCRDLTWCLLPCQMLICHWNIK